MNSQKSFICYHCPDKSECNICHINTFLDNCKEYIENIYEDTWGCNKIPEWVNEKIFKNVKCKKCMKNYVIL